jgi:hypothetical protein
VTHGPLSTCAVGDQCKQLALLASVCCPFFASLSALPLQPPLMDSLFDPSISLCLSSNSVVRNGSEGVIELLERDHSVTVVIESSHKRVLFVVAQIDVQTKTIIIYKLSVRDNGCLIVLNMENRVSFYL